MRTPRTEPARVLVVDDDAALVRLLVLLLKTEGYEVSSITDSEQALNTITKLNPDVIILDLTMPKIDGRSFYKLARERGFAGRVIVCSAFGAGPAQRELGADGSIDKPFDPIMLIDSVRTVLA